MSVVDRINGILVKQFSASQRAMWCTWPREVGKSEDFRWDCNEETSMALKWQWCKGEESTQEPGHRWTGFGLDYLWGGDSGFD